MKIRMVAFILSILLSQLFLYSSWGYGQDGLAAKYPGDRGIENDPDVIFVENFEENSMANVASRWSDISNIGGMSLVADVPAVSLGSRSIQMTSIGGVNDGGHLFKKLPTGYNQLYMRYYIKYASGGIYHHNGGKIGGYNPASNWPIGGAGTKPTGSDRFSVGAEPNYDAPVTNDGVPRFDLYTYWMNMRSWQNPVTDPSTAYYGNDFIQDPNVKTQLDKWMCVEVMVKMNNPVTSYNGELTLWIDGQQVMHLGEGVPMGRWVSDSFFPDSAGTPFEGFQWRNMDGLNINWIWLLHYVTDDPPGYVGKIWFDDLVVAKSYIGPINVPDVTPPSPPGGLQVK